MPSAESRVPPRRLVEIEHAVEHQARLVRRGRVRAVLGGLGGLALLVFACTMAGRIIADLWDGELPLERERFVPAVAGGLGMAFLAYVIGLAGAGRRHFARDTPKSAFDRFWEDPVAAVGGLAEPGGLVSPLLFLPFLFAYFGSSLTARAIRPGRAEMLAAAELLHRSRDPAELARMAARGGASFTRGWRLIEALGLERIHASRRSGPGLSGHGTPGAPASGAGGLGADGALGGFAPRWESRDWAVGERFHLAFRSGRALVEGREALTLFDENGARLWHKVFPAGQHVLSAAIAPDGGRVAVITARPELWVLTGDTGHPIATRRLHETTRSVCLTDGAERVLTGDRLGNVRVHDRQLERIADVSLPHPAELLGVACETDHAVAASLRGVASVFSTDGRSTRKVALRSDIRRIWMEEDGERAMLLTASDGLMAYDLEGGHVATYGLSRPVVDGDSDAPGDLLVLLTVDGRLVLLDSAARILWQGEAPPDTVSVRLDQDGRGLWCHARTGAVRRLDPSIEAQAGAPTDRVVAPPPASGAAVAAPADGPVERARAVELPSPRGFRSVLVDPEAGRIALAHPDGSFVLLDSRHLEEARHALPQGTGSGLFADRGGLCVVASDERVSLIDTRSAGTPPESRMMRAPALARVADSTALAVGSADGEIALATATDGLRTLCARGARVAALSARDGVEGTLLAAALGDGRVRMLEGDGSERFRVDPGSEGSVARIAFGPVGLLVAEPEGRLRVFDTSGAELASRRLALPVIGAELMGSHFVVTDRLGNLHRFEPDLASAGTRPPPTGLSCLGLGAEGETWIAHVHRHLLTLNTWRGRLLGRWEVPGTPLDLEPMPDGGWCLLTPVALLTP